MPTTRVCFLTLSLSFGTLSLLAAQETAPTGSISGVVRFTGKVPASQKIVTTDGSILLHDDLVVDAKTKGLRHVAAILQNAAAQPLAKDARPVLIDQRDMVFLPRVVVVQEGRKVRFENNDHFNHAVMSATTTVDNLFNVLTPANQPFEFAFKAQKSPVQIGCPLHPWMRAWVYVVPHPFAAVTDAKGQFKIEGVAPGKHTLVVTHPDTGMREARVVDVAANNAVRIEVNWASVTK